MHKIPFRSARCIVVTVSDTRTVDTDKSGQLIKHLLEENTHICANHIIVKDEQLMIDEMISEGVNNKEVDIILMTGGTGIAKRDVTIEVVEKKLTKIVPGFGELFRMISYKEDIGSRAMMSRAIAGTIGDKFIVAMPGSSGAVRLAMKRLILPEIPHIIHELKK